MGDEADQEMLDACDSESEQQIKLGHPLSNPANDELRNGDAPAAANKETLLEIGISVDQTQGLLPYRYNIQDCSSFTSFIEDLRNLLAEHPEPEHLYDRHPNLSSSKKHPLLAKPRGDQQPERRIEVKLQVSGQGKGATSSSSTTLVIRDDNVDVMGFSNRRGVWYELGNNRCLPLPPRYNNSELLPASWVINKEQVTNLLVESSTRLGKTFAVGAVRALHRYPEHVADGMDPRLALVGLSVMVCDSARMNPVLKTIAAGWNTGTRFTEQLMTDTVGKYEWMSRSLWQWSRRNYAKPHPAESDLQAVRLVLNGPPEVVYTIGDEVSFISFMIDLRRMITDRPVCKDILDEHKDRNLSSTHEHPLLPRQHARHPERWLHVKLQVAGKEMLWTTLLMRDDNLYVHGFINKQGVVYGLVDKNKDSAMVLPDPYLNRRVKELKWSVQYITMLKAQSNDDVMKKLAGAHLGREFAMKAVGVLSRYPDVAAGDNPRLALVGLIFMVCESARMNPLHNAFARGWGTGTGFTEELMKRYVWNYSDKSRKLRKWKDKRYAESGELPHPIKELQDVYLVLNTTSTSSGSTTKEAGDGGSSRGSGSGPNQPREAGDNAGSKTSSASQPGKAGDAGTGGGSAFQPGDAGHAGPNRGNNCSQPQDAYDDARDDGRPMVELLAIHADQMVVGTKIIVYDGIRGQIIYRKEEQAKHVKEQKEQGEQGVVELVLTGPYTCISAEGCFAIQIEIPDDDASSSTKDDSGPIEWEWDCYDPKYAAEVDKPPVTQLISGDSVPSRKVAEVTYAVMSNAREATVQVVKFRLKLGRIVAGIGGVITARIDGFEDKYRSVLFRCAKGTRRYFSRTDSWFFLELARNVVAVPCGRVLHIEVDLQIVTEDGKKVGVKVPLRFDNGISSSKTDDDNEVEMEIEVTWYPQIARPSHLPEQIITIKEADEEKSITAPSTEQIISGTLEVKMVSGHLTVVYTIGDAMSFTEFIMALRGILADHPDREDVFDRHSSSILSSTKVHPVLAKQRAEQPARWIHVKLRVVKGEEMLSSTTLIMRDDNLYICGFVNQQGDSFELIDNPDRSAGILPADEYSPRRLSWGVGYRSLLDADTEDDLVRRLGHTRIGRDFAMDAVHVLSCFPAWVDARRVYRRNMIPNKQMNPRLALAGLIIMVCESARMNRINDFIERCWSNNDMKLTNDLMRDCVLNYGRMSLGLLIWKRQGYTTNPDSISRKQDIYLVLNSPRLWLLGHGRPRVELLAMRADFGVVGTTVIVFDGKRGHIIYRKEEQEEKGMVDLVLTGPYTGISEYGCFAIKIDIPAEAAGSSKGDAGGPIKWEWDCYGNAWEVDMRPSTWAISSGPGRNVEVTYAVMSDAQEATVQVKLRLKDGNSPCSVHGHITARIDDFRDPIILFKRTLETAQHFSPTHSNVIQLARSLKLARNVFAVPRGRRLHVEVFLQIQTSNEQGVSNNPRLINIHRSFDNHEKDFRQQKHHKEDADEEVEVTVAWYYPDSRRSREIEEKNPRQPDISYKVGQDAQGFSTFITELRRLVAEHPRCKHLMADHPTRLSSTHNHPVLPKGRVASEPYMIRPHMKPKRLIHIKLEAVEGVDKTSSSITLVMRDDNLDVISFINQDGDCYVPGDSQLPSEYKPKFLGWGKDYGSILNARSLFEDEDIMGAAKLGKAFAEDAVHYLSRFKDRGPSDKAKRSLMGLKMMVCDSARMEPVRRAMAGGWNNKDGAELTMQQLQDYRQLWPVISGALLDWRDHAYQGWPQNEELEKIGIRSSNKALEVVPVVFNDEDRICTY